MYIVHVCTFHGDYSNRVWVCIPDQELSVLQEEKRKVVSVFVCYFQNNPRSIVYHVMYMLHTHVTQETCMTSHASVVVGVQFVSCEVNYIAIWSW